MTMKNWVLFVFAVNPSLERFCDKLEEIIADKAANYFCDVQKTTDEILSLRHLKIRLMNLRVIHNSLSRVLTGEEKALLCDCVGQQLIKYTFKHSMTYYRKIERTIKKCLEVLARLGFDESRFAKDYEEHLEVLLGKRAKRFRTDMVLHSA